MTSIDTELGWLTDAGRQTLDNGYLLPGEEPIDMFYRVANAAAAAIAVPEMAQYFLEAMKNNWLCLASPVAANMGTDRGLPISCFGIDVPDSVDGIWSSAHEMAMMGKNGGGVGVNLGRVRERGAYIRGNGQSEGIIPWAKVMDVATWSVSQGNTRRGAGSVNLRIDHPDIHEFLKIRRPQGEVDRQCLHINHCVQVTDEFMDRVRKGDAEARELWVEVLRTRLETGEPYIQFIDTVNRDNPLGYKGRDMDVKMTNICSEITLYTDDEHSFVCCLSSLNLARWDEWNDYYFENGMTLPELSVWFLDGVMQEFLDRSREIPGMERARRGALKGRPLGLGVLGWHSLLQKRALPFDTGVQVMGLQARIFDFIKREATKASGDMARQYGEPEWCEGTGMRHTHLMAIAPTATNSIISGNLSAGIEPIPANTFTHKTAKGTFLIRNPQLEVLLEEADQNTPEVWTSILENEGSVQHLDFLSAEMRQVFLTAREISQFHIVRQAAARQTYIDQAQSVNLFFPFDVDPRYFHKVHMEAWEAGMKSLYYCRSTSVLKGDVAAGYYAEDCTACEG